MFAVFSGPRATQLVLVTPPSSSVAGASFGVQPVLALRDARGALAVGCAGAIVRAEVVTGPGTLIGTATATVDASGACAFSTLGVSAVGTYTLRFRVVNFAPTVDASGLIASGSALARTIAVATVRISTLTVTRSFPSGFGFDPVAAGLTLVAQTDFAPQPIGGGSSDGYNYYGDASFLENATASIQSPPQVFRTSYAEGSTGDGAGGATIEGDSGLTLKRIYARMRVYFSPNYVVHTLNGSEKLWYPVVRQVGGGVITSSAWTIGYPDAPDSGNIRLHLGSQTDRGPQSLDQAAGPYITRGSICTVEWYGVMNSTGNSDGVWQSWINATQVVNRSDINYGNGVDAAWIGPRWTGTRGGGASSVPVPTGGMYRDYDYVGCWGATS